MLPSTLSSVPYSLEQLRGRLVADARDARDVVRGVALQAEEVGDQLGRDAVAVDHRLAVVDLRVGDAAARGHHPHARLDQLEHVAVAGHDHHVDALLAWPARRAWRSRRRPRSPPRARSGSRTPPRAAAGAATARCSRSGRAAALGLVLLVVLLAARTCRRPSTTSVALAPYSVRIFTSIEANPKIALVGSPARGGDRLGQREERPVGEAVAVDQEQLASVGGH